MLLELRSNLIFSFAAIGASVTCSEHKLVDKSLNCLRIYPDECNQILEPMQVHSSLGGGFKYFLNVHPYLGKWWEMIQFDSYFSDGLKPPTSSSLGNVHVFFGEQKAEKSLVGIPFANWGGVSLTFQKFAHELEMQYFCQLRFGGGMFGSILGLTG